RAMIRLQLFARQWAARDGHCTVTNLRSWLRRVQAASHGLLASPDLGLFEQRHSGRRFDFDLQGFHFRRHATQKLLAPCAIRFEASYVKACHVNASLAPTAKF